MSGLMNPSSYAITALSHQTGLSIVSTVANTLYNIGTSFSLTRNGIIKIQLSGHVSGGVGAIAVKRTRGTDVLTMGGGGPNTLFSMFNMSGFNATSETELYTMFYNTAVGSFVIKTILEMTALNGDSYQIQATNSAAGDTVYVDDLLVMLQ